MTRARYSSIDIWSRNSSAKYQYIFYCFVAMYDFLIFRLIFVDLFLVAASTEETTTILSAKFEKKIKYEVYILFVFHVRASIFTFDVFDDKK